MSTIVDNESTKLRLVSLRHDTGVHSGLYCVKRQYETLPSLSCTFYCDSDHVTYYGMFHLYDLRVS